MAPFWSTFWSISPLVSPFLKHKQRNNPVSESVDHNRRRSDVSCSNEVTDGLCSWDPVPDKGGGIFGVVLHQIHPGWYGFQELQIPAQTSLTSPPQAKFFGGIYSPPQANFFWGVSPAPKTENVIKYGFQVFHELVGSIIIHVNIPDLS